MSRDTRAVVGALVLFLSTGTAVAAQRAAPAGGHGGGSGELAGALRIEERGGGIRIDGVLDDDGWADVDPITDFVQGEPVQGGEPEQRTEVRILFDDQAIYIGARLHEPDPGAIARQLVRRDETGQADYFEVMFDTNLDRRTGYRFRVTAAGVQSDGYLFEDNQEDDSWDAVWESDVAIDGRGWTAEMRIPWSQIRYEPGAGPQTWGVNFVRWRVTAGERSYYSLIPRDRHGKVSFFHPMTGVRVPAGLKRIEVRPYALAQGRTGPAEPGDPYFDGREASAQAGFDLRYGLGSAFTLDATVNPDFGQVELDPAVINLSAFETFFPEKRPFFVEDARILDFSLSGHRNTLFYSRRIGREPRGYAPAGAEHTRVPDQSTILGAGKLTGRTAGGLSLGALAAVTSAEEADAFFTTAAGDSTGTYLAEPRTYVGVARVQQDLREGNTAVGGIVTGLRRDLPADASFDFLPSDAYSVGVDFEHMWGDREWALEGFWAGSSVRGEPESLVRIQRSSNHYYQRPDSDFEVDSTATSMAGAQWRLQFERRSGEHWTGSVWAGEVTPGFEINELGYSRSSEQLDAGMRVSYREIEPGPLLRSYALTAWTYQNWRHRALDDAFSLDSWGHAHKGGALMLNARGTLNSFWGGSLGFNYHPEYLDDGATRGGPLMVSPARVGADLRLHTDRREGVVFDASLNHHAGDGGHSLRGGLGMTLRPSPGWELRLEPSASTSRSEDQYVAAFDDDAFGPTYGRRYLFGELDRTSLSLETRLNVTFTPSLTLQLFAQPLIETGRYTAYKQLAVAESFDFHVLEPGTALDLDGDGVVDGCAGGATCVDDGTRYVDFDGDGADYAFNDRDFNLVSLRGNAVLRWEYRPGSTMFVVWQQRRSDYRSFGDFDLARDGGDMVALHPDNVFIVKVNYWLGL
ncbi:MAG: DUF5916 domain-containing protein [Gemmatimonadota bacterium]